MWFKNLLAYRLTQNLDLEPETLEDALSSKKARSCASQELSTYGFVAPFGKGEDAPLVHVSGEFMLICAQKEERILPGSVVRDAVKEKVDAIEADLPDIRQQLVKSATRSKMKSSRPSCHALSFAKAAHLQPWI